ncbi:MAG TPA: histidine kinase, partial [Chitinophagaceae bacterium]|nr:histidine kinase [Chitinophagaceae bacterium]
MKNHKVRHHIIFWVAYFLFQAYLEFEWMKTTETYGKWSTVKQALYSLGAESMLLPIKLSTTYLFLYILRKVGSEMNKAWLAWILTVVLMAGATLLTRQVVIHVIIKEFYNDPEMVAAQQKSYTIFRFLWGMIDVMLYIGTIFAIEQFLLNQQSQQREKLLQKEKLEAELKFLRTQTNPHFLFNTLNNIYALARKKSDDTANVVMKLSKLLRFMLYESRNDSISIAEEIRVLEDYIELERIRYNER